MRALVIDASVPSKSIWESGVRPMPSEVSLHSKYVLNVRDVVC